eukprot:Hpha_TRINITY_DN15579_c2_g4::TRINITY_DN15579_c2_g4_i1::g.106169::m.106169
MQAPSGVPPLPPSRRTFGEILAAAEETGLPERVSGDAGYDRRHSSQNVTSEPRTSGGSVCSARESEGDPSPTATASASPTLRHQTSFGAPAPPFFAQGQGGRWEEGSYVDSYGTVVPEGNDLQNGVVTLGQDAVEELLGSPLQTFDKFQPEDRSFHEASRTARESETGSTRMSPTSLPPCRAETASPSSSAWGAASGQPPPVPPAARLRRDSAISTSAMSNASEEIMLPPAACPTASVPLHSPPLSAVPFPQQQPQQQQQQQQTGARPPVRIVRRIVVVQPRGKNSPAVTPSAPPLAQPLRRGSDASLPVAIPLSPELLPTAAPLSAPISPTLNPPAPVCGH